MLEVNILLKEAGLWRAPENGSPAQAAIMSIPLFETIGDLEAAPKIMTAYFGLPEIAGVGQARGHQEGRSGYSDSNKEGVYSTSTGSRDKASQAVEPGDSIEIRVKLVKIRGNKIATATGECKVNGKTCSSAELMFMLADATD